MKMFHLLWAPQPGHPSNEGLRIHVPVTADAEYVQQAEFHVFLHYYSLKATTPGRNSPAYQTAKKHLE